MRNKKLIIISLIVLLVVILGIYIKFIHRKKTILYKPEDTKEEIFKPKIEIPKQESDIIEKLYKETKFSYKNIKSEEKELINFARIFSERVFSYSYFSTEDQFKIFYPKIGIKAREKVQNLVKSIKNLEKGYSKKTEFSFYKLDLMKNKAIVKARLLQTEKNFGKSKTTYKDITLYFSKFDEKWILDDYKIE